MLSVGTFQNCRESLVCFVVLLLFAVCKVGEPYPLQEVQSSGGSQQDTQCYEGVQSKKSTFWYVCRQGKEVPVSCIAPDGITQFAIGQTFKTKNFLLICSQPTSTTIQMAPVACVTPGGQTVEPGSMFTSPDQAFYFKCIQQGNSLQTQLVGCVGPSGEVVGDEGLVRKDPFVYKCKFLPTGIRLVAYACTFDNRQYYPGQDILTQAVWYKCETDPQGGIGIKLKGCIKQNQKYEVGSRFNDGNFVFTCYLEGNKIYPMAVGCMEKFHNGTLAEFDPGHKWLTEMRDAHRYLIECQKEGQWLKRVAIQCHYNTPDGIGYLEGGCMKKVGRRLIQCLNPTSYAPNVRMRIHEPTNDNIEQDARNREKLRFC